MKKENNENLPIPSLRNIQSFLQVANCNSINTAAEQLNITPSAVSHQISTLERFIGKKLFIRNGKGVKLTLTGEKYLRDVSGAISEIGRATDQIINEGGKEILRVHSSPTFGLTWLMRRLGYFRDQYPDITLNLTCSYENLQFSRDNIDIDIRHGIADWDAYKVLTIKKDTMIVMASPAYLKQHPVINPEDLLTYELISSTSTLINWDKWFSYHNLSKSHINHSLSFDRSFMSFEAAKMGLGFILESKMLGTDFLREGSLVPVLSEDYAIPVNAHHIVMPHVNERTPKIKAFTDWVRKELQTNGFAI